MKYTSSFNDLTGRVYDITITTESGSSTKKFTLGEKPLTTTMDSDGKHIYAPIKTTGATVTMVTETLPFDIYSAKAQGTKVEVTSGSDTVFCGFVTPCAYTQGFDDEREEVEIECVDGIAVLKEIPYRSDSRGQVTMAEAVFKCLKQAGLYRYLYVTNNVQLTSAAATESVMERFRVTEKGFFGERKDTTQTDDDIAWSCYDVLYEIMQFMGYTLFADGQDVVICDYDAVKAGNNRYYRYSLTGSTLGTKTAVTLSYSHHVCETSYASDGAAVSLDSVYNKVTVKDEFQTYDSLFPDFGDITTETNITPDSDPAFYTLVDSDEKYLVGDLFTTADGEPENFYIFVHQNYADRILLIIMKFYYSPVMKFARYSQSTRSDYSTQFESSQKYSDVFNYHGAYYCRWFKRELTELEYVTWHYIHTLDWNTLTKAQRRAEWVKLLNSDPAKVSMSPMIVMMNGYQKHIGPGSYSKNGSYAQTDAEHCRDFPYIRLRDPQDSTKTFGGENAYIIIKGSIVSHDEERSPFPMTDGRDNADLKREGDYKFNNQFFNWARLKWGDRYWDGASWTSTASDFKLPFKELDTGKTKVRDYFDKEFEVYDTAMANYACSEAGYYIPAPTDGNLSGTAEFIIYCQRDWWGRSKRDHWNEANRYSRYYNYVQSLRGFQVKTYLANGLLDEDENDSDTYYTNTVSNGSVSKMDEITFKVCTYDGKAPTYSAVDYDSSGKSVYVTKTYNKANNSGESGSVSAFDDAPTLTQEEHLIWKLATQYGSPRAVLEVSLHNDGHRLYGAYTDKTLSGKTFVADTIEVDYKENCAKIRLIEKA